MVYKGLPSWGIERESITTYSISRCSIEKSTNKAKSNVRKMSVSDSSSSLGASQKAGKLAHNYSWWPLIGMSFSLTNSWLGVSSSFVVGLSGAGQPAVVYGLIFAFVLTLMCGYSLSEFSRLLPNSAGTSFWTLKLLEKSAVGDVEELSVREKSSSALDISKLSQKEDETTNDKLLKLSTMDSNSCRSSFQKHMAIAVGLINYFGCVFTTASIVSSLIYSIMGIHSILHPSFELKRWHTFLLYEILTIFLTAFNCNYRGLPFLSSFGLAMSLFSYAITFILCLVSRSDTIAEQPWPKSEDIFYKFHNNTGWKSNGMAFLVSLINPLWSFVGIDSATHMVDEVGHAAARVLVPKVIMTTIVIGFVTSFSYSIALFYCVRDTSAVLESIAPAVTIYYQATGNRNLAVFMQASTIVAGLTCGVASGTWQSRMLWALSREMEAMRPEGTLSRLVTARFASIDSKNKVPLYAHLFSQVLVAIIGCIMLGSTKAFNAIISAAVTLLIVSYAIPSVILLVRGRNRFIAKCEREAGDEAVKAPSKWGVIPHTMTVVYALFCLVMLSFPYVKPVTVSNMNYVSVVYGAIAMIIGLVIVLFSSI